MGVKLDISAFFVSTSIKLEEDKKLESEKPRHCKAEVPTTHRGKTDS